MSVSQMHAEPANGFYSFSFCCIGTCAKCEGLHEAELPMFLVSNVFTCYQVHKSMCTLRYSETFIGTNCKHATLQRLNRISWDCSVVSSVRGPCPHDAPAAATAATTYTRAGTIVPKTHFISHQRHFCSPIRAVITIDHVISGALCNATTS